MTVTGQHNNRKLAYTRATHSDLESTSLNVSRQDCFHLTLDQAANFLRLQNRNCEPDKYLDFVVEIKKRDVPVENALDESGSWLECVVYVSEGRIVRYETHGIPDESETQWVNHLYCGKDFLCGLVLAPKMHF